MLCFQSCGLRPPLGFNAHPSHVLRRRRRRTTLLARGVSCTSSSRDFWREKEWNTLTPFRTSDQAGERQGAHRLRAHRLHTHLMRTCPQRGLPCPRARTCPPPRRRGRRGRTYSLCECFHSNIVRRFVGRERDRYPSLGSRFIRARIDFWPETQ